jgi:hypothetical protein
MNCNWDGKSENIKISRDNIIVKQQLYLKNIQLLLGDVEELIIRAYYQNLSQYVMNIIDRRTLTRFKNKWYSQCRWSKIGSIVLTTTINMRTKYYPAL